MLQSLGVELPPIITWYLVCFLLGVGMFPFTFTLFRHVPDRGFSLSRIVGLFLLSYGVWLAGSLGISPYNRQSILVAGTLLLLGNGILLIWQWHAFWQHVRERLRLLLLIELVFLGFFLVALVIRMYSPDITGAEKEADFTLLNALLHSTSFPPKDTWFAGETINYYYFGYLIWATMIHLTGVIAPIGFNLAVITIVALSAAGVFGLVYALTHRISFSSLAALFLMGLGNLDGLMQVVARKGHPLPFDWWQSSRVIPDTINEFPFFSFLLGDLHAHFMSIPGGILFIGLLGQLLITTLRSSDRITVSPQKSVSFMGPLARGARWHAIGVLVGIGLLLGGLSVINGWDYPTYLLLTIGCMGFIMLWQRTHTPDKPPLLPQILTALGGVAMVILLSRLCFRPFYQHFTSQISIGNLRLVDPAQRTALQDFLIIYGAFLWGILLFFSAQLYPYYGCWKARNRPVSLVYLNVALLTIIIVYIIGNTWVIPVSGGLAGFFLYLLYTEASPSSITRAPVLTCTRFSDSASLPYLLLFIAFAILTGCEIVYIKDFYGHPLERQNTVFKFYYQVWIFLSIGVPYLLARFSEHYWVQQKQTVRRIGKAGVAFLCMACAIYPVFATYERAARFRGGQQGGLLYLPTLNGISYIAYRYPQEYEALMWIQKNLPEEDVILEATGKPYSFFGRVASVTGRSTVLGWGNHEALWRDQTWQSILKRTDAIKQIYEARDKTEVRPLLDAYDIAYVYVGKLEYESYDRDGLKAFAQYFPVAYQNAFVTIYRVS